MVKISWVRIPRGEFTLGLTNARIALIRRVGWCQAGCENWSTSERAAIEGHIASASKVTHHPSSVARQLLTRMPGQRGQ